MKRHFFKLRESSRKVQGGLVHCVENWWVP